jgi:hypothetical protein
MKMRCFADFAKSVKPGAMLFMALFALWGCKDPLDPPESVSEGGKVEIGICGTESDPARTFAPSTSALRGLSYELTFASPSGASHEPETLTYGQTRAISLAVGNWTITAAAKAGNTVSARGSWSGVVSAGATTPVSIALTPTGGGAGTFTFTATFPDLGSGGTKYLFLYPEGGSSITVTAFQSGVPYTVSGLSAGFYRVNLWLTNGANQTFVQNAAVHIYGGLTTTGSFTVLGPTPIGTIDVWGGKLIYTYRVLSSGTITGQLVGGGSGGSGAAAARDGGIWGGTNRAYSGGSGSGGPTILRVNNQERARADGGRWVNGVDTGTVDGPGPWRSREVYLDGNPGNPGQVVNILETNILPPYPITVNVGDIIKIEVGWGGGGSGGAAINDTGGTTSSGNVSDAADKTRGSGGSYNYKSGTSAGASAGGMGGMHSLLFPGSTYSNLQAGQSSSSTGGATGASGGQSKGAGGARGDEYATGGMYASGGGGGAAGGFTLRSSTVALEEVN